MDMQAILERLPHRYPFLLVDRVLELHPGKSIRALKNVTYNEPFFPGHFPGRPVMPGVMIIEALAQAAGILCFVTGGVIPIAAPRTLRALPVTSNTHARPTRARSLAFIIRLRKRPVDDILPRIRRLSSDRYCNSFKPNSTCFRYSLLCVADPQHRMVRNIQRVNSNRSKATRFSRGW